MKKQGKLELTWVGKNEEVNIEPRILIEDKAKSYGDLNCENMIIYGDNLIALKALEQDYSGQIKCIYIDPPYNTGSAFESYDDGLEHSIWLNMIRARLKILWELLTDNNGVILISINDDEGHYLKVMCDELFGRKNFINSLIWNYEGNTDNQAKIINYHEYILVYSKSGEIDNPNVIDPNVSEGSKLFRNEIRNTIIKNGHKNPHKTVVLPVGFPAAFESGCIKRKDVRFPQYSNDIQIENYKTTNQVEATSGWSSKDLLIEFINNAFNSIKDAKAQDTYFELKKTGAIEVVKGRKQDKGHFISVLRGFGTTNQMRLFLESLGLSFTYPKPVDLIAYLIEAFTNDGDIVLDSFAGSGTTAHAVMKLNKQRKTNRKFIIIELEDKNVHNVILPRMKAVIDGNTASELESHPSGFKYYELAEPLLVKNAALPIFEINPSYTFDMVVEAICKIEGFKYNPQGEYHGISSENRFIHVTNRFVNSSYVLSIAKRLDQRQSLLIYCTKKQTNIILSDNIEIKKIPKDLLKKCNFESEGILR